MAWQLFGVAFTCDFAMNVVLWLGSVMAVFLPSPNDPGVTPGSWLVKDTFIRIYAEMGSMADVTRYTIQLITSLVIFIYAYMALELHNINQGCEWYDLDQQGGGTPGVVSLTDLPSNSAPTTSSNGYYFLSQQATVNYFYRQIRLNGDPESHTRIFLSKTYGHA